MKIHRQSALRRRVSVGLATVMATAGLASVMSSPASATTDLTISVAVAFGANKVTSEMSIYDSVAVISRTPQVLGSPDDATARNTTKPTLTCTVGLGTTAPTTVTSTGEYVSHDGVISMTFIFGAAVPATVDTCTLSNSTFIKKSGNMIYPVSAAGQKALWGDPAVLVPKAKKRLSSIIPQLRAVYGGKWGTNYTARISRAVPTYKFVETASRFDATSTSTKTMYILRWPEHPTNWINVCQRFKDGRLYCMRYNPVTNKATFSSDYRNTNYYTETLTTEAAS